MGVAQRQAVAEGLGTFVLVLVGTGAIVFDGAMGGALGPPGVSAAFGLVVFAMILALGDVSGAHINPAVTLGFVLRGELPRSRALVYCAAQLGGALLASLALRFAAPAGADLGVTRPAGSALASFVLECALSAGLMGVVLVVAGRLAKAGVALAVGTWVGLAAYFGGPLSGASMNPARSFGPALASGELGALWIYLVAPCVGALVATAAYSAVVRTPRDPLAPESS